MAPSRQRPSPVRRRLSLRQRGPQNQARLRITRSAADNGREGPKGRTDRVAAYRIPWPQLTGRLEQRRASYCGAVVDRWLD